MNEPNYISIVVYPQSSICWALRVPFSKDGLMVARKFVELMESLLKGKKGVNVAENIQTPLQGSMRENDK